MASRESRHVCLICHREIPRQDTACPYCRSRVAPPRGETSWTLGATVLVMLLLMAATAYLARSFHAEAQARGRRHAELAATLSGQGRYDSAIEEYREALTYARDNPDYRLHLAVSLFDAGRTDEAKTYLNDALAVEPTLAVPNLYLARLAAERRNFAQAVIHYRRAMYGQWPDDPVQRRIQTRFELVDLLERQGAQMQAVAELLDLLQEEPDDPEVASRTAWSLLLAGAPSRALEVFRDLIAKNPRDAVAHSGVAEAEFALDHYLTARTHFRRALRLNRSLTHLTARARLCDDIIALDPTVRGLGRLSRHERSVMMVRRALTLVDACLGPPAPDTAEAGTQATAIPDLAWVDITMARDLLDGTTTQAQDDDATDRNVTLAERLWRIQADRCPDVGQSDEALARVIQKLSIS